MLSMQTMWKFGTVAIFIALAALRHSKNLKDKDADQIFIGLKITASLPVYDACVWLET